MAEIIMGIDHGNGNMKGVHVNFPCGLVRYTSEPGRFMNEDILEYNGVYYTLSETRMPFKADKTVDEDYFMQRNKMIIELHIIMQCHQKKLIGYGIRIFPMER